jgi:ADP-ribose pyrophosphatase YjhB (NUDIX family)
MENGETVAAGAARETLEEAGARIEMGEAFSMISVPRVNQVHVFFRARVLDLEFRPGAETLEAALFEEPGIPWKDIAFRTVSLTLERWFADRRAGKFGFHAAEIPPP